MPRFNSPAASRVASIEQSAVPVNHSGKGTKGSSKDTIKSAAQSNGPVFL